LEILTKRKLSTGLPPDASIFSDKQDLSVYTLPILWNRNKG